MKQTGETVDERYLLEREIGHGAHGQVFAAVDSTSGRRVAIKLLNPSVEDDEQFVQRLWREARSLAALWGTSVVEVYAFGQDQVDGSVYMVMELLQGETLSERLEEMELFDSRMSAYDILLATKPIATALHTAHKLGIIHRDIKPSNIFLVSEEAGGGSRLMDFGLAKVNDQLALTRAGFVAGSPNYMAPEMLRSEPFDHRIDVYSLAAVIYRSLAGQPLFPGENQLDILLRVLKDPRPRLTDFRPELSPLMDDWVQDALSLDPSFRFLDMPSMWNGLLFAVQHGHNPSGVRARLLEPLEE